jgi:aminoglycoside phosphotransferase (APT) family kinase protein
LTSSASELEGLVDVPRLEAWIGERLPGAGAPLEVRRITSGASNEIFELRRADHCWVLRRPARVPQVPPENMLREFRVLRALEGTPVPHPKPLLVCDDPRVIGAFFYLMERIEGFAPRLPLPPPFDTEVAARRGLGTELVDALAALARVDWRAAGLEGLGRPEGYLERQVDRWLGQLERYRTRELPGLDLVAGWLREARPEMGEPGLLHGDFQLANAIFHHGAPARLAALVDWEQSTIGDPLVDLGWLLALWDEPGEEPIRGAGNARVNQQPGFPTRAELAARYAAASGRSLDSLGWYEVLALFKLACVLEGAFARRARGQSDSPRHAGLARMVPALVASAARLVGAGGRPR